jgi:hypothetical protein
MSLTESLYQDAYQLLGEPMLEWKFKNVEYNEGRPNLRYYYETGEISISLSKEAEIEIVLEIFQFSHELCHLFYPGTEFPSLYVHQTNYLNEGIATYFSIISVEKYTGQGSIYLKELEKGNPQYYSAFKLVEELLKKDGNAIRKLRSIQPRIDVVTKQIFQEAEIVLDTLLIEKLLALFKDA